MSQRPAIEIYSIGTELLNGQIQDTNSFWMAQRIAALGGYVRRIAIVDDDMDELTSVLKDACARETRVVITTGGLGPTPDDMTVEALARILGVGTQVDESLIERFMENRGIEERADVSEGLVKMATKPEGSLAHPNPAGVAPCVESQIGSTTLFSLPGPPREVEALFRQSVEDALAGIYDDTRVSLRVVVNLPESQCGPILHSVMELCPNTYLKAFVALSERAAEGQRLPVDIVAWAKEEGEAKALLDRALAEFKSQAHEKGSAVEIIDE
jgi:molybdenum cofactor synthesis domain-containing protein